MTGLLVVLHMLVELIFNPSTTAKLVFITVGGAIWGVASLVESRRLRREERAGAELARD
jgi:hypothetical protein